MVLTDAWSKFSLIRFIITDTQYLREKNAKQFPFLLYLKPLMLFPRYISFSLKNNKPFLQAPFILFSVCSRLSVNEKRKTVKIKLLWEPRCGVPATVIGDHRFILNFFINTCICVNHLPSYDEFQNSATVLFIRFDFHSKMADEWKVASAVVREKAVELNITLTFNPAAS